MARDLWLLVNNPCLRAIHPVLGLCGLFAAIHDPVACCFCSFKLQFHLSFGIIGLVYLGLTGTYGIGTVTAGPITDKLVRFFTSVAKFCIRHALTHDEYNRTDNSYVETCTLSIYAPHTHVEAKIV